MATGVDLIKKERWKQITTHDFTIGYDVANNSKGQLLYAARRITSTVPQKYKPPVGWDKNRWIKMCGYPMESRMILAGAWIAAELDRLQHLAINP